MGGGNAELLMLVVGSLGSFLPETTTSIDREAWSECMHGISQNVAGEEDTSFIIK